MLACAAQLSVSAPRHVRVGDRVDARVEVCHDGGVDAESWESAALKTSAT